MQDGVRKGGSVTRERSKPYIWITSLAKVMSGDVSCAFSPWFAAHFEKYDKVQRDFDGDAWVRNHTALLRQINENYKARGVKTRLEDQNWMRIKGTAADLGAKPDLIAYDHGVRILDAKTGKPKDSDRIQVKLYMWLWILENGEPKTPTSLTGQVIYPGNADRVISSDEIDEAFRGHAVEAIKRIAELEIPDASPSPRGCSYCDITKADCPDRIDAEDIATPTELF